MLWCNLIGEKAGSGSLKGEVRGRKLGVWVERGGESACLPQFQIPKTLSRQSPTPLAFSKAVREGGLQREREGPTAGR